MVQRAIASQTALLADLMELSRLQAGQERRRLETIDVAELFTGLVKGVQLLAEKRNLSLSADGPSTLVVDGDRVKLMRIVQNLVLNALSYTSTGGVSVTWGDSRDNDPQRWMVSVQDTGPGFQFGAGEPLADALNEATAEALDVEPDSPTSGSETVSPTTASEPSKGHTSSSASHRHGEGIGLSIVKRLCELLDASVEWEGLPGEGTTVRVIFPRSYSTR
jgi:signal transduction histidine kinase